MRSYNNASEGATVIALSEARATTKPSNDRKSIAHQLRENAVALSRRGFRVFPVRPDEKTPAIERWPEQASDDPVRVRRFWTEALSDEPLDFNIGIATGRGLFAIDVDDKGGKSGSRTLRERERSIGDLPVTFTTRTPSGGRHILLRTDPNRWIETNAGTLGEGLDVRGDGGYVVGPGSIVNGTPYTLEKDLDPAVNRPGFAGGRLV